MKNVANTHIIRHADQMNLRGIARSITDLASSVLSRMASRSVSSLGPGAASAAPSDAVRSDMADFRAEMPDEGRRALLAQAPGAILHPLILSLDYTLACVLVRRFDRGVEVFVAAAGMAAALVQEHGGDVPAAMDALVKLPGVGRKTAHVITSVVDNQPNMAVDTHVFRVSARIGLTKGAKTPLATEQQLMKHVPKELVHKFHHWLVLHGRYVCVARSPKCGECGVRPVCHYFNTVIEPAQKRS